MFKLKLVFSLIISTIIIVIVIAQVNGTKITEYNNWLNEQKKMIDGIGNILINLSNKEEIEDELVRLFNNGLNVEMIYVGFSDNSLVTFDRWIPPVEYKATERFWYQLGMDANGNVVESEFYEFEGVYITIVKYIGIIDGLDAVLGADIRVPNNLINGEKKVETISNIILFPQLNEEKIEEYIEWLDIQKNLIDEIGSIIINISDKKEIENFLVRLFNEELNVEMLYVGFSDNTAVFSEAWTPPDDWNLTERGWYRLAMDANGKAIESELYGDIVSGEVIISIVKNIGIISGLDAVFGADIIVPSNFLR